jgi:hypothetical protein
MHLSGHLRLARCFHPARLPGWTCLLLLVLIGSARAADLPAPVTLDLPIAPNLATPSWLGHPETPATDFATLNLPILAPDSTSSLLVTVYFQEKQGGFMRISWKGTQQSQVLVDNFYENIGIANQRSLLISPATLIGDGILSFQCGDSDLGIQRIKLEWLENKSALVSPSIRDLLVTPSFGPTQPSLTLNGQETVAEPGAWDGDIVTVPLTDQPARIEDGVEFNIDLDKVPVTARLTMKVAGLPLSHHLVVWVNEKRAGTITPTVPDLLDGGYLPAASATAYSGWRDGSFFVPVALLKPGNNALQLSEEDEAVDASGSTSATPAPLAIKTFVMQLNYQTPPASTVITAPAPATDTTAPAATDSAALPAFSMPTGPIAPVDSSLTSPATNAP